MLLIPSEETKFYTLSNPRYQRFTTSFTNVMEDSNLIFGSDVISSCKGVQQEDPLDPFLFSLGIQDIISKMKSEFNVWYLDDGTLGGDANTVLEDAKES